MNIKSSNFLNFFCITDSPPPIPKFFARTKFHFLDQSYSKHFQLVSLCVADAIFFYNIFQIFGIQFSFV